MREVLGWDIGHAEEEAFWAEFLRRLLRSGLRELRLVTSDAHERLKKASPQILVTRNDLAALPGALHVQLAEVPKSAQQESLRLSALYSLSLTWRLLASNCSG